MMALSNVTKPTMLPEIERHIPFDLLQETTFCAFVSFTDMVCFVKLTRYQTGEKYYCSGAKSWQENLLYFFEWQKSTS